MFYAFSITPITHRFRDELPVVGDENTKFVATLSGETLVPNYEFAASFSLIVKWDCPNITRKVINYVHAVQVACAGCDCHQSTQIDIHLTQPFCGLISLLHLQNWHM